ncbi:ERG4/ERG24 ergosterol biosynthesis protein [Mycena venus]|uniref:7-dehydrocholesterol reductase n=1 Tax=Mycena venus TaxID=2733690 RepID=A0A8H7DE23_9AGAR|nr:ERG4/ERG24 ergosterol biosynthesis protein [Mycena venus]
MTVLRTTKLESLKASRHINPLWGRSSTPAIFEIAFCATLVLLCPASFLIPWSALELCDGSIGKLLVRLGDMDGIYSIFNLAQESLPSVVAPMKIYGSWVVFQATLFIVLPGTTGYGETTPAGNRLWYKINGLLSWFLTIGVYILGALCSWWDADIVAKQWMGLMVAASTYGIVLTLLVYIKAHVTPSHSLDRKFSGSLFHDIFAGIELNPRIGDLDLKLFNIGRVGMTAWTIVNLSFAASQYQHFGYVCNGMIVVNILQSLYILDFFYQEDWYIGTIDIAHDHFGFYLAWGGAAWIPSMYTLQAQYLAHYPFNLSQTTALIILLVGVFGYWMFRASNHQRIVVRRTGGKCVIWGKKPVVITAHYTTSNGERHTSLLLCSGFWGIARHFNYIADLILAFAMCAPCGTRNVLPYAYFVYMTVLLIHRSIRDEDRCSKKYGKDWELYKARVPYALIPGIY